ncbi:VOC family protein [Nocardia uniformis]|uniref:VOC family protein n=1 Tax=Nocardia uniformis TaxID=53432 RepID=A0A849CBU4_9NOCA|nr:VOC family protein [Nocardia uniformis]
MALSCVTLDTADPRGLAAFYSELLDWRIVHAQDEYVLITDGRSVLRFGLVEGHAAAPWPEDRDHPKRVHLDLEVADIDQASARAVELGATVPTFQPGLNPDWEAQQPWAIVLDPEGHPICLNLRDLD